MSRYKREHRDIKVIRAEFELERDRLHRMFEEKGGVIDDELLAQSQLVDMLHVEHFDAERELERAS